MINTLEEARLFFRDDRYAMETGIELLEAEENRALVALTITPSHKNAGNRVMGAVYFTMADFAFAVAANFGRPVTFTTTSQISFLAPARGERLFAEAKIIRDGKKICFSECRVTDDLGTEIALVTASGARMA